MALHIEYSTSHSTGFDVRRVGSGARATHARDAKEVVQAVRHYFMVGSGSRHSDGKVTNCPFCREMRTERVKKGG